MGTPPPVSSPGSTTQAVPAAGTVSQPPAHSGEAASTASLASEAPVSREVEVTAAIAETRAYATSFASGAHISQGERSQPTSVLDGTGTVEVTPAPHFAGLVSDFLPVDRATVERAVDRFLGTFENAAAELTSFEPSSALLISTVTISLGMLMLVAIKRLERADQQRKFSHNEMRRVEMALLGTLPNSWKWDLAHR
jgi:hypothetical protein